MHSRSLVWASAGLLVLTRPLLAIEDDLLSPTEPNGTGYLPGAKTSSKLVLEEVDLAAGVELPLTGGATQLAVLSPGGPVADLVLEDVQGRSWKPGGSGMGEVESFEEATLVRYGLPAAGLAVRLVDLPAGIYRLRAGTSQGPAAVIVNEESSGLVLHVRTLPLASHAGEPVTVEVALTLHVAPVTGATVEVQRVDDPDAPSLRLHEMRPGRYGSTLYPRTAHELEPLLLRVDARGHLADSRPFLRSAFTGAMVTRPAADIVRRALAFDGHHLTVPVSGRAGRYRLEALFSTHSGAQEATIAFSSEDFRLEDRQTSRVVLAVPPDATAAERVTLRLLDCETLGVEREMLLAMDVPGAVLQPLAATPPSRIERTVAVNRHREETRD